MANNRIQVKRTSTAGRTPNTTNVANTQYIAAGEFAFNMTDQILYTSDGTNLVTVGANIVNQNITGRVLVASNLVINSTAVTYVGNTTTSPTVSISNTGALSIGNSSTTQTTGSITVANSAGNVQITAGATSILATGQINAASYTVGTSLVANTIGLYLGANLVVNSTSILWTGNTTTSPTITLANTGSLTIGNSTTTQTGSIISLANSSANVQITPNSIRVGNTTINTFAANTTRVVIANGVGLEANGGLGTSGQLLTSNGSAVYWGSATAGNVEVTIANANPSTPNVGRVYWNSDLGKLLVYYTDATPTSQWVEAHVAGQVGPTGPAGPIAGLDTQIAFNDGTYANGSANLIFTKANSTFTTNNAIFRGAVTVNGAITTNSAMVLAATGGEGGELRINNSDNATVGLYLDVSSADNGRLYTTRNNANIQIGQLTGTGGTIAFYADTNEKARITNGGVGIGGITPSNTAFLELAAGNTTFVPFELTSGSVRTTAVAGGIEYDGVRFYGTSDTTSGRGYVPTTQIFRLTADGSAIGPTIANYFGTTSAINLAAGGVYEVEAYCYFTKTTAGTVTVTLTSSQTPVNINGILDHGAITGGTATGASNRISLFKSASTAAAFGASGSLTTGVNHAFVIKAIVQQNASLAGTLTINFTSSAGTVTPLLGSYYKVVRLPAGNVGSFA